MGTKQTLPFLTIKGKTIKVPIIQGGMGIGVSLSPLASAVAREGGIGIVSSACLDRLVRKGMAGNAIPMKLPMRRCLLRKQAGVYPV